MKLIIRRTILIILGLGLLIILIPIGYIVVGPSSVPGEVYEEMINHLEDTSSARLVFYPAPLDYTHDESRPVGRQILLEKELEDYGVEYTKNIFRRRTFFQNTLGVYVFCYDPRHSIELGPKGDGAYRIDLCFSCGNMQIGEHKEIYSIPPAWSGALESMFLESGFPMKPDLLMKDNNSADR